MQKTSTVWTPPALKLLQGAWRPMSFHGLNETREIVSEPFGAHPEGVVCYVENTISVQLVNRELQIVHGINGGTFTIPSGLHETAIKAFAAYCGIWEYNAQSEHFVHKVHSIWGPQRLERIYKISESPSGGLVLIHRSVEPAMLNGVPLLFELILKKM